MKNEVLHIILILVIIITLVVLVPSMELNEELHRKAQNALQNSNH